MSILRIKSKWILIPISFLLLLLIMSTVIADDLTNSENPVTEPQIASPLQFSDIEPGDDNYVAINYLKDQGIINGYKDGKFKPYQKVNRVEALKMLILATNAFTEKELTTEGKEAPFADTPLDAWYSKYLIKAKEKGIVSGYEDSTFKPEQTVTLVEALKIYFELQSNTVLPQEIEQDYIFADTSADSWYIKYVAYAAARDMLIIDSSNNISPDQEMTRGYLSELIYRKKMNGEGFNFGKATFYGEAVQGHITASGEIFDKDKMTAAHKTLPFGTIVEVTNLANGKEIEVKITDRGPYGYGRILDLSSGAFSQIAKLGIGVINVQYKIVEPPLSQPNE